jgi:hypothetical protein
MLTVKSFLDPHMINKHKDEIKSWFDEFWVVFYKFLKWDGID